MYLSLGCHPQLQEKGTSLINFLMFMESVSRLIRKIFFCNCSGLLISWFQVVGHKHIYILLFIDLYDNLQHFGSYYSVLLVTFKLNNPQLTVMYTT